MKQFIFAMVMGVVFTVAQATDVVGQRYIDQLSRGGSVTIKKAARSIYNTGDQDTEVLDVAAEVLLQRYPNARGRSEIDTLSWLCRALGSSRNSRYYSVLNQVANSDAHRKLRKYASRAADEVGQSNSRQYVKGSVDLVALRHSGDRSRTQRVKVARKAKRPGKQGIDIIREGMSMEEVFDLIGQPTATSSHQTGKAWIPFNFSGKDLVRTTLLYKGQGRVVCSHDAYSSTSRVLEVIIDPEEMGYP